MSDLAVETPVPCHRCDYDVRAQPIDGRCPECEADVAESRRLALIPRRPAWRESDPRWRRRLIAGMWVLTLMPLMAVVDESGWDERVPTPAFFAVQHSATLADSYLPWIWPWWTFCIGVALLFARERFRQRRPFDWTRRWGVVASYLVATLGAIPLTFITALVMIGIGAMFLSITLRYQPPGTDAFVAVGGWWLRHAPHPSPLAQAALATCSAVVVLLACAPLYDALRSVGRRGVAVALLLPLVLGAFRQLAYVAVEAVDTMTLTNVLNPLNSFPNPADQRPIPEFYFDPTTLAQGLVRGGAALWSRAFFWEASKWLACAAIALRLTLAPRRRSFTPTPAGSDRAGATPVVRDPTPQGSA